MDLLVKGDELWLFIKLAKYKSNSLTETLMWYGFTQRPGCRHSGFFSKRSPSVLSNGMALNRITITRSRRQTLSACLKQSIRRILPFWSGFDRTQMDFRLPIIDWTKSSRLSCVISFLSLPKRRDAHFCFTSVFSFCKLHKYKIIATKLLNIFN